MLARVATVCYAPILQVVVFVKSLKFQRSTAFQHGRDLLQLVEEYRSWFVIPGTERIKPVMVLMVDGGQDENPRFYGQVRAAAVWQASEPSASCSKAGCWLCCSQ